jgi:hypothetical protein
VVPKPEGTNHTRDKGAINSMATATVMASCFLDNL